MPSGYRAAEILAYHARDPESLCEKSEGNRIWKALLTPDGPAVLEISLEKEGAWCRIHAAKKMGSESMAHLHAAALRMLGLNNEIAHFEKRVSGDSKLAVFTRRKGLRVPTIPTGFDGLCWAILGLQINVKFASTLRREIVQLWVARKSAR